MTASRIRARWALACAAAGLAACAPPPPAAPHATLPRTRAELSDFAETSSHADVVAFLDSLRALGAPLHVGSIGTTTEGREIPYVIASRPLYTTPEEARRSGRPIVYVQGNIHAGEVEGKEALQALVRDLVFDPSPNALDSVVLIAVPIYNADGNERFAPVERQRSEQHGPARVGQRPNAQGLDLNRDYMKAEAPETRASLEMFRRWDPDVFVDLHTTNGSYHGYALTYAPSLVPLEGGATELTRESLLPELRRRMRARHGLEVFDYGNFSLRYGSDVNTDSLREGWYTYDHRPRFGTNYYGLRGGVAILSEAYSHDPFPRRVESTYAFVSEILSLAGERSGELLRATRGERPLAGRSVPVRSELTRTPYRGEVLAEMLEADPDSVPDEPGVHPGIRRTGRFRSLQIPIHDRFTPTLQRSAPTEYLVPERSTEIIELLREHGIEAEPLREPLTTAVEVFAIDSVRTAERPFQGHWETRLEGRWRRETREIPAGTFRIRVEPPLGLLTVYLLEPESDDGIVSWCCPAGEEDWRRRFLAGGLAPGSDYPILRVPG